MDKEEFVKRRTEIISKMLGNPDESGIYPTTTCFAEFDDLYDEMCEAELDVEYERSGAQLLRDKEFNIDISSLDLTKQTISLGDDSGPHVSLMKGHVDALTFVKAFWLEGWDNDGENTPTEEQFLHNARCEKSELVHTYGIFNKEDNSWSWDVCMHDDYAEKITVRHW
jgi:hypothetical protein